jgi:hypothetical protein
VDLLARAAGLQASARTVLAGLGPLLEGLPAPVLTGSAVSGLMVWPDLDVMVLGGPDFGAGQVHDLIGRALRLPGVTGFDYRDERDAAVRRDRRHHIAITQGDWRIDLTVWLHDDHRNLFEWHQALAARITPDERLAVLRIKDVWHRRPEYPDEVGGVDVYAAVLDHGVRTPEEFAAYLVSRS